MKVHTIKAAPVIPQSVPVTVPTLPTIPDISIDAEAVAIIAPKISIVHPNIVSVALPLDDPEIPQPVPLEDITTTKFSVVVPKPPCPLPDNSAIPQIDPENETIDEVQPADTSPSPTVNVAGEPIISLNHGYKWYKYENPNDLPTNERVHAKQWQVSRPSCDKIS